MQHKKHILHLVAFVLLGLEPGRAAASEALSIVGELPPTEKPSVSWGRDPFVPPSKDVEAPEMNLLGIFYNSENPSAIIDNKIVYIGSVIGDQKIIDIRKSHVILLGNGEKTRLELVDIPGLQR
ncbi:MAG: hypothetical protein V3W31_02420 [Thermodesulfobacteriota bacterium]